MRKKGYVACFSIIWLIWTFTTANFLSLRKEDTAFVLEYVSSDKGCFPYEIVTGFHSLSAVPKDGDFWDIESFYSRLRHEGISQKEWEECKKLYKVFKMRNLSDFDDIYNIQDVIILAVILEYRCQRSRRTLVSIRDVSHLSAL